MPYLKESFGFSHITSSSLFTVRNIVFAISMVVAGRLIDRYNPKTVILLGGSTAAIGMFLSSYATNMWQLLITYAVLPGIGNGFYYIPSIAIISRWFNKNRAFAIGIATLGVPISGMIINPLTAWLISDFGLENSLVIISLILIVLLLNAFVMRSEPNEDEAIRYGETKAEKFNSTESNWTVKEAIQTSSFWTLYAIFFLGMNTFLIIIVNLFDYAVESGIDPIAASIAPAAIAFGSIFGRLVFSGILTKYLNNRRVLFISYFLEAFTVVIIIFSQTVWSLYLFGFLFGFFYSGHMPIFPSVLSNYFGTKVIGAIYGVFATSFSVASITGPLIAGYLYDKTGSHYQPIIVATIICFTASLVTFFINSPKSKNA